VTYTATIKKGAGKPSAKKPVPIAYTGTLVIGTDPPGQQPDIAPITTVYFAKSIKQNAKLFPSCTQTQIDGQAEFPAACRKAVVGGGTATAYAGSPGSDISNSVKEDLTVKAVNGAGGKQLLLIVSSGPSAPVAISNRVIPGTLKGGKGPFGYSVEFVIPDDLQQQLGLSIAAAYFNVTIKPTTITKKVKGKKQKISYLMLSAPCAGGAMPVEGITQLKDSSGAMTSVTSDSTAKC
jgi:hypothetical protein